MPTLLGYWPLLIIVSTVVRIVVVFLLLGDMPLVSDAQAYSGQAKRLLSTFPGTSAYYWPPGMSYVLALAYAVFDYGLGVSRAVAVIISVLNVVMIARLSAKVLRDQHAARLGGWIAAFYPAEVMMAGQTYSQPLAMLCLLCVAYWLLIGYERHQWSYFAYAGLAWGWGCLTRPSMVSVGILLPIVWWAARHGDVLKDGPRRTGLLLSYHLVFYLCAAVCIVPVMYYNATKGAGWTIATNAEINFFAGNNAYTPHYKTSHFLMRPLEKLDPTVRLYIHNLLVRDDAREAMTREAMRYIYDHPVIFLWRTLNRIRAFWGFDYTMSRKIQWHYGLGLSGLALLLLAEAGGYCLVMLMTLAGMHWAWQEVHSQGRVLLILLVLGYQLPYALALSTGVYHFPVMGLLIPFAGVGLSHALSEGSSRWALKRVSRKVWLSFALFLLIQLEYGYYAVLMA
jgi:4-amino-4-deoxy-L-arabinose transferase-like glycosyltransferase